MFNCTQISFLHAEARKCIRLRHDCLIVPYDKGNGSHGIDLTLTGEGGVIHTPSPLLTRSAAISQGIIQTYQIS